MTQEDKLKEAKRLYQTANADQKYVLERLFPELKESEDERIRKEIIKLFKSIVKTDDIFYVFDLDKENVIAWLEKQGEHKKFRDSIQVGDKVTKNEDGVLVNLSQLIKVAKKDEKQGEQNLADIIPKNFEKYVEQLLSLSDGEGHGSPAKVREVSLELLKLAKIEQKPVEWSKEDLSMIGGIRSIIEKYAFSQSAVDVNGELCEKEFIDADSWLKSLKDRILPQPKQEWSEEDETNASYICAALDCYLRLREERNNTNGQEDLDKARNWLYNRLKSLRPQSQWKPSDEQMKILNEVLSFAANHESPYWNDYIFGTLSYLIRQLKKLREE